MGMGQRVIATLIGHADVDTTQRYTHVDAVSSTQLFAFSSVETVPLGAWDDRKSRLKEFSVTLEYFGWTPGLAFYLAELGDDSLAPARVCRVDRGRAKVIAETGEQSAMWPPTLEFVHGDAVGVPAIGDWCACSQAGDLLRIEAVFPRTGTMIRGVASGHRATQVLAANVDVAFIVTGLDGDFSARRIERYLTLARAGGVRPVVVLNKVDVCDEVEQRFQETDSVAVGVTILRLCALEPDSSEAIRREIGPGQTAVFLGSSGVGKSTLINRLLGKERQVTAEVRAKDDTGRHTTTRRELIPLVGGGVVIDTPGIREVGVLADEESLGAAFGEITALGTECRFNDCRHESEPGCAVRRAVEEGVLNAARLQSFVELRREAESAALRRDTHAARQEERRTIGQYRKRLREAHRFKGRE